MVGKNWKESPMSGSSGMPGTVYLVGAGPGHPGLITRWGYELLQNCDAVAYDALIPLELISALPGRVERHYVGRRAGRHSMPQSEKNRLLVDLALRGLNVVRLKGGDASFFGGSVEEAESLAAAGIQVVVVPGVTAASAVAAASGLPLTGRQGASWVFFATGHGSGVETIPVPWREIAALRGGTIVVYMGLANLDRIVDQLIAGGNTTDTPCMVVQGATTGLQRILDSTLGDVVADCRQRQLKPPALVVIGQVVRHRSSVGRISLPFSGRRVLVPCCAQESESVCVSLRDRGMEPLPFPAYILESFDDAEGWARFAGFADSGGWCVFATELEVQGFIDALFRRQLDLRYLGRMKIAAFGHAVEAALMRKGIRPDVILALKETVLSSQCLDGYAAPGSAGVVVFSDNLMCEPGERVGILRLKLFRTKSALWESHWKQEVLDHPPEFILFRNSQEVDGLVDVLGLETVQALSRQSGLIAENDTALSATRRWNLGNAVSSLEL
jgi:uroporphyrinogen III methyltransferase / synthase